MSARTLDREWKDGYPVKGTAVQRVPRTRVRAEGAAGRRFGCSDGSAAAALTLRSASSPERLCLQLPLATVREVFAKSACRCGYIPH